jgi:integrase
MKSEPDVKSDLPIIVRNGRHILQKTFKGVGQKQVALGTNSKVAKSRAIRFLATAETSGFNTALEELKGKPVIKSGTDPTFAEMSTLYYDFRQHSEKSIADATFDLNLKRLKLLMTRAEFKTIRSIDKNLLAKRWFTAIGAVEEEFRDGKKTVKIKATPTQRRTFASAISAASGVFKKTALAYYRSRNIPLENPFEGMELVHSKVAQYVPMPQATRKSIWEDCCTELAPNDAMVVLMALGIGMRRSEICAAIPEWFSLQDDKVMVHIKEEDHFQPKNGESGVVPVALDLYEALLKLRGDSDSQFFVPSTTDNEAANRLNKRYDVIIAWLRQKGLRGKKPIHNLRKELGSIVAKHQGILEASKILRNTLQVCAIHYAGIAELNTVDMGGTFIKPKPKDPGDTFAEFAASQGLSAEELRARLDGQHGKNAPTSD